MNSLLLLCLFAFASLNLHAADPAAAAKAADLARGAALRSADTNALNKILADDFKYTHSNGFLETKTTHIKSFIDGLKYSRFQTSDVAAQVITPDVVVLNGKIDQSKGTGGKMTDFKLLFHSVWRKKGNDWQVVSLQTALPPAAAK